jgi:hypothetical protein
MRALRKLRRENPSNVYVFVSERGGERPAPCRGGARLRGAPPPLSPSVYRGEMHGAASQAESRRDSASARAPLGRPDELGLLGRDCG